MLAQFKVVKIVDVSVMPTGMLLGRSNLPGNSPESEIQLKEKNTLLSFIGGFGFGIDGARTELLGKGESRTFPHN